MTIRVLQVGVGPIGCAVANQLAARKAFRLVGAVDTDPGKIGRDLGEIAEIGRRLRIKISDDLVGPSKRPNPALPFNRRLARRIDAMARKGSNMLAESRRLSAARSLPV